MLAHGIIIPVVTENHMVKQPNFHRIQHVVQVVCRGDIGIRRERRALRVVMRQHDRRGVQVDGTLDNLADIQRASG